MGPRQESHGGLVAGGDLQTGKGPASHEKPKRPLLWLQFLIIVATLFAVAVTIFLGERSYLNRKKLATEQFNQQQLIIVRSSARGIEGYFKELSASLTSLSKFPCIRRISPECRRSMRHTYEGFPPRTSIRLLDKDGVLRAIYPSAGWRGELIGRDYSKELYFQETAHTEHIGVHAVANEQGLMRIRIAVPVYLTDETANTKAGAGTRHIGKAGPKSGTLHGVVVGSLDPHIVTRDLVHLIVSGRTGYAWLLDDKGVFVAHHEKEFINRSAFKVRREKNPRISYQAIELIQRKMLAGREGLDRYVSGWHREKVGEIEKLIAYTPVRTDEKFWSVAVCAPVSEVEEAVGFAMRSELYTLGFVVLLLMTGGVLFFVISHRWSRSLEQEVRSRTRQLHETTDYLTRLIRFANAPIIVWNPDRKITIFNKAFEEMSGRSEAETLGEPLDMLFPPESRSESLRKIESASSGQYWENVAIPILRKDGRIRMGLWNSANIHAEDGETLIATIAQGQDITERKEVEDALRESESRLRLIMENTSDGINIVEYNPRTYRRRLVMCNDRYVEMSGRSREELMATDDLNRFAREIECHSRPFHKQTVKGLPSAGMSCWLRPDGKENYYEWTATPLKVGEKYHIIGVDRDITERKRAEETMRQSEEQYRAIFESATDAVLIIDLDGNIVEANPAACATYGYSHEEMIGLNGKDIVHPKHYHLFGDFKQQVQSTGQFFTESVDVRKDGSAFDIEVRGTAFTFRGKPHLLAVVRDITERKQAERDRQGLEEQLRQAVKMEAIGRLASGVAHDFNNMLAIIRGYADLLIKSMDKDDEHTEDIRRINTAARRATALTGQLLAFGRKQTIQPRVLQLNEVIADVDSMLKRTIGEDIELVTIAGKDLWCVKADPTQIEQIMLNLTVNAREAMPKGGKLVIETVNVMLDEDYVRRHADATAGEYAMLAVSDTGVGMSKEVMAKIFEPFFTTKERNKGTGLGLSTTYGIVKQCGGHIRVYSEPGHGTTFRIYLPRAEEPDETSKGRYEQVRPSRGTETVLVVEDESSVRALTCRVLREQGYTVLETAGGDDALRAAGEQTDREIHLVITDVVMPRMSGKELSDRLKAAHPNTKVLYISGYTDNAIVHHGVLDEGVNYLAKPFSSLQLIGAVRRVLDADTADGTVRT